MSNAPLPQSEFILYQTEGDRTRIQYRFDDETRWLTQEPIVGLFQITPQNATQHLKTVFAGGELGGAATCKDYLQVRPEGGREVTRKLCYYQQLPHPKKPKAPKS